MLTKIHQRICGNQQPSWRQGEDAEPPPEAARVDEFLDAAAYQEGRKHYIKGGKGTPPPGAEV